MPGTAGGGIGSRRCQLESETQAALLHMHFKSAATRKCMAQGSCAEDEQLDSPVVRISPVLTESAATCSNQLSNCNQAPAQKSRPAHLKLVRHQRGAGTRGSHLQGSGCRALEARMGGPLQGCWVRGKAGVAGML